MSKYNIHPQFECQNRTFNVKLRYLASVRMSNTSMNVELQYLATVRLSKWDFESQSTIFDPSLTVKIGFFE